MLVGALLWYHDGEYKIDRHVVRCFKIDRLSESEKTSERFVQASHARVRYRKAATQTCASQALTLQQAVEQAGLCCCLCLLGNNSCDEFEQFLFARDFGINKDSLG